MRKLSSFGKDTGLQIRMATTLFLLGLVYVVFVGALFAAGVNAAFIVIVAGGLALLQLFASDKMALAAMGARVVTPAELEGVMAHELTHVANRDVMVMTLASFFATIAAYIVQFGMFFGGGGSYSDDDDNLSFIAVVFISIAVYIVSFLLMQALSRYREFAADRGAAIITGRPSALASALMKISSGMHQIPQKDLRATAELQAFYIFPPGVGKGLAGLFSTHPPMEKRIAALQRLEQQLQTGAYS